MKKRIGIAMAIAVLTAVSSSAHAGTLLPINISYPLIESFNATVTYSTVTNILSITAPANLNESLTSGSGFSSIPASLSITALIDTSGNPILDGGGHLQGTISIIDSGTPHTYALSSTLAQFGTNLGNSGITQPEFDFVFTNATGDLGPMIGEQVHTESALRGSFSSGFTSLSAKTDTFPVPEPASLSILGLGGAGLLLRRRSRKA